MGGQCSLQKLVSKALPLLHSFRPGAAIHRAATHPLHWIRQCSSELLPQVVTNAPCLSSQVSPSRLKLNCSAGACCQQPCPAVLPRAQRGEDDYFSPNGIKWRQKNSLCQQEYPFSADIFFIILKMKQMGPSLISYSLCHDFIFIILKRVQVCS